MVALPRPILKSGNTGKPFVSNQLPRNVAGRRAAQLTCDPEVAECPQDTASLINRQIGTTTQVDGIQFDQMQRLPELPMTTIDKEFLGALKSLSIKEATRISNQNRITLNTAVYASLFTQGSAVKDNCLQNMDILGFYSLYDLIDYRNMVEGLLNSWNVELPKLEIFVEHLVSSTLTSIHNDLWHLFYCNNQYPELFNEMTLDQLEDIKEIPCDIENS